MKYEYLNDTQFLNKLDLMRLRTQYARITLLSFDEKIIGEIQGNITGGNLSVNGSAAVRRTISLTMLATEYNSSIENLDNQISLNKKVKIETGYKNPFNDYLHYGDIIWFPCGLYIISGASISRSTSGWTISINGKDKMCLLDGTVGGTLPASVAFHEIYNYVDNDSTDILIEYPTIYTIIQEAVHHYGKEDINNIIINDLDLDATMLIQYVGEEPIYFNSDYTIFTFDVNEAKEWEEYRKFIYGQDVGYKATEFTYPGELILNAGETVASLLDKISKTLGNYEYFYDIEGRFIFQQIKNYLNTTSPLKELRTADYMRSYSDTKYAYSMTNLESISSININPKYDNIKNDFIVWGSRKSASGAEIAIRYHLAIDAKPSAYYTNLYMRQKTEKNNNDEYQTSIDIFTPNDQDKENEEKIKTWLHKEYCQVYNLNENTYEPNKYYIKAFQGEDQKNGLYQLSTSYVPGLAYYLLLQEVDLSIINKEWYESNICYYDEANIIEDSEWELRKFVIANWDWNTYEQLSSKPTLYICNENLKYNYVGPPLEQYEWREELYRRAIYENSLGNNYSYYDEELLAEWRKLYDPTNLDWKETNWWNPLVDSDPRAIDYWLDFIDNDSSLGKYSIASVGRRTKILNDKDATSVFNKILETPVLFNYMEEGYGIPDTFDDSEYQEFQVPKQYSDMFIPSTSGTSCFEKIRELLYQNLTYNTTITLSCSPRYYFEPNNILYIQDKASGINGNYVISQFSLPLAYNGTMSITATEALQRV